MGYRDGTPKNSAFFRNKDPSAASVHAGVTR